MDMIFSAEPTLIVYHSLSGNTKAVSDNLSYFMTAAKAVRLERIGWNPTFLAHTVDRWNTKRRRNIPLYPLGEDISAYRQIVLLCPVWYKQPCPAIETFLSQYDINGKTVHCLLTYERDIGQADQMIREKITQAGASVASLSVLKMNDSTRKKIDEKALELYMDDVRGISLRKAMKK